MDIQHTLVDAKEELGLGCIVDRKLGPDRFSLIIIEVLTSIDTLEDRTDGRTLDDFLEP
ncbi:hypothetical protein SDC9_93782 [bioreactor metagenome]|uniref:Uncharacterized protein n=1 Tax=bioreactor metagenome TaxID=1076179 RepID=A0A645ABL3_9ZZZZ